MEMQRPYTGGQIPIVAGNEVIGVLSFILDSPKHIQPEITDMIEILTSQLGNTLTRIRSEELVRQRENELSELYKAMQELGLSLIWMGQSSCKSSNYEGAWVFRAGTCRYADQALYPPQFRDDIIFQFMDLTGRGGVIQNTFPFLTRKGDEVPLRRRKHWNVGGSSCAFLHRSGDWRETGGRTKPARFL
jgi:hypothetical protein